MTCQTPRCERPARVALATEGDTRAVVHLTPDDAPATALRACRQHAVELIPTMLTLMMAGDDSVDGEAGDTLGCVIAFPGPRGPVKLPI